MKDMEEIISDDDADPCVQSPKPGDVAHSQGVPGTPNPVLKRMNAFHISGEDESQGPAAIENRVPLPLKGSRCHQKGPAATKRGKKRKRERMLNVVPVTVDHGTPISCVLIPNGKGLPIAVPLWPQYNVTYNGCTLEEEEEEDATWLSVCQTEQWLNNVVQRCAKGTAQVKRQVLKRLTDHFKAEFVELVEKARKQYGSDKTTLDGEDGPVGKLSVVKVLTLNIGGCMFQAVNTAERFLIKADEYTAKFILEWMSGAVKELTNAITKGTAAPSIRGSNGTTSGKFHFAPNKYKNHRDKVEWKPFEQRFVIHLQKAKGKPTKEFSVPSHLRNEEYEQYKAAVYWDAIQTWNLLDGSLRHRLIEASGVRPPIPSSK